jgi:hypothetical protein
MNIEVLLKIKLFCRMAGTASVATDPEIQFQFQALPDFLRSSGVETGYTQARDYN